MAHAVFTNNARTTLSGSLTNVATSASVVDGSVFPAPTGGDYAYLTIEEGVLVEIVKLTARSTNTLTITRAQDGTTGQAFTTAATVSLRLPRVVLDEFQAAIDGKQTQDAELSAIAGLTSAADSLPYFTGSGTAALATFTGAGRALVDDADASAQRTTLGVAIGTNVQAYDAGLQSIAGLTTLADRSIYTTASDTYAVYTLTAAGRAILDDADAAAQRTTLGLGTSATVNTGTSGATIPLLNAANTWSALQTFSGAVTISGDGERLTITGATDPYIRIRDTTNTTDLFLQATNTVVNVGSVSNHDMWFYTNSLQRGRITAAGQWEIGSITAQTTANLRTRQTGNNFEWGHTNTAGYQAALGAEVNSGAIFITFNAEAGTTNNTYRTRGLLGSGIRSNNAGGMTFFTLTNSNADNQSPTDRMAVLAGTNPGVEINGRLNITSAVGTSRSTFDWGYTQSGLTIWNNDNTPLYLGTTATNRVAISATGDMFYTATPPGPSSTVSIGFRGAPRNRQDSSYTLVLADAGFSIVGYGSTASQTWTIPANGSVAYPIGTTITFVNMRSVACSIACTTDTMYLAGVGTTGTRTLASYGWATAVKVDTTNWMIGGTGLT